MPHTHYDVLEVSPSASGPTIRAAYRSLMQRSHPDRLVSRPAGDETARRLNLAYEVLSDQQLREAYDAGLRTQVQQMHAATVAQPLVAAAPVVPEIARPAHASRRLRHWGAAGVFGAAALGAAAVWFTPRPAPGLVAVGEAQLGAGSPALQVLIDPSSIRRVGDVAQVIMVMRPHDRRPFELAGTAVLGASQIVAYDCAHRTYQSWQKRLLLADGGSVSLPDAHGEVAPASAHDAALQRACAPWWRR